VRRGTRALLLVVIAGLILAASGTYLTRKRRQQQELPAPAAVLPANVASVSRDWVYTQYAGQRPIVEVRARQMRQLSQAHLFELSGVELKVFSRQGDRFDRVVSEEAIFDSHRAELFSGGRVAIFLDVAGPGSRELPRVQIEASGVRLDVRTGKVVTEEPLRFAFREAEGSARGASYDPAWHELNLLNDVEIVWPTPGAPPLELRAAALQYKEDQDKVYLPGWCELRRGNFRIEAASAVVTLQGGSIHHVDAQQARGSYARSALEVRYVAPELVVEFTPDFGVRQVVGRKGAWLATISKAGYREARAVELFLDFTTDKSESRLRQVLAKGDARFEAWLDQTKQQWRSRHLASDVIKLLFQPSGEELETVETQAPGVMEAWPAQPSGKKQILRAERIWFHYGAQNRLQQVRASHVELEFSPVQSNGPAAEVLRTWSEDLLARLDEQGEELASLEQWGNFRLVEGTRWARAQKAELDQQAGWITLWQAARYEDEQVSLAADQIRWSRQKTILEASGNVDSAWRGKPSRQPGAGPLDLNEPVYGKAGQLRATNQYQHLVYEGEAVLWQGASRIQAHRVEIDRASQTVVATGGVRCRFAEQVAQQGARPAPLIHVEAPRMVYDGQQHVARYEGGVTLERAGLRLWAGRLDAYFEEAGDDSQAGARLKTVVAEQDVRIVRQLAPNRWLRAFSQRAEYEPAPDRTVLSGGPPRLEDSLKGVTQGEKLIYLARDDRLLVEGDPARPAVTRLRR